MVFAILFVLAFLVGAGIYYFSRRWIIAVVVPMMVFAGDAILDFDSSGGLVFTLVFGLTLVFFASLLGAYVVQIRTIETHEACAEEESSATENEA
jgi:hypothetical protein